MIVHDMDLMIITKEAFPHGGAATNRILSYAVPLSITYDVRVYTLYPTKYNSSVEIPSSGNIETLTYEYVGKASTYEKASVIKRSFDRLKKRLRLFSIIRQERPKTIVYVARDMHLACQLKLLTVFCGIIFFREISESPEYITNKIKRWFTSQLYRLFDGMIVITEGIRKYFYFIPDNHFYHLPMTVDMSRFDIPTQKVGNYFFYCSGGNSQRDGLLDIVKGFSIFRQSTEKDYQLVLATFFDDSNAYDVKVRELIKTIPGVIYKGLVSSEQVPYLMSSSLALLITPHQDYKTRGFPTKLGEYMASGRPVICSAIATLKNELDEDVVVFVEPNSPKSIANAMKQFTINPIIADTVGAKGKEFVKHHFTAQPYLEGLAVFLGL